MDIMVGVDLAHEPEALLERAIPWATRMQGQLHLRAASVASWDSAAVFGGSENQALALERARRHQAEARELTRLANSLPAGLIGSAEMLTGDAGPALIRVSDAFDLVLVGTHGRKGVERVFLGSVAERVVRRSAVPVLVVPSASVPLASNGPLRVVVPVDARDADVSAVRQVHDWFDGDVELLVVHALADLRLSVEMGLLDGPIASPEAHPHMPWAEPRIRQALSTAGFPSLPITFVLATNANPALDLASVVEAHDADLVALPTHGRRGWSRVAFGSVTERLIRVVPASCLVVR